MAASHRSSCRSTPRADRSPPALPTTPRTTSSETSAFGTSFIDPFARTVPRSTQAGDPGFPPIPTQRQTPLTPEAARPHHCKKPNLKGFLTVLVSSGATSGLGVETGGGRRSSVDVCCGGTEGGSEGDISAPSGSLASERPERSAKGVHLLAKGRSKPTGEGSAPPTPVMHTWSDAEDDLLLIDHPDLSDVEDRSVSGGWQTDALVERNRRRPSNSLRQGERPGPHSSEESDNEDLDGESRESSTRDMLFARHLASILNHSLTLCHSGAVDSYPRPTVASSTDMDESAHDVLQPSLHPAPHWAVGNNPSEETKAPVPIPRVAIEGADLRLMPSPIDVAKNSPPEPSPRSSVSSTSSGVSNPSAASGALTPPAMVLPAMTPVKRSELIARLDDWRFDAHSLTPDELWYACLLMFESIYRMSGVETGFSPPSMGPDPSSSTSTDSELDVAIERTGQLLMGIRSAYHMRNAYHNFAHATDVLQACYTFLAHMRLAPPISILRSDRRQRWTRPEATGFDLRLQGLIRPMDAVALMMAAIGHDVGHPGLSNAYMVNARTPLALVYNDKSVLENFHCVTLIRILRKYGFSHWVGEGYGTPLLSERASDFRKVLVATVLTTDMSRHFPFVARLQDMRADFVTNLDQSPAKVEEQRLLLCSALMKCGDISNPTRPHPVARAWSSALFREWAVQARIEARFKLPISVMTLDPAETKTHAKSQVGFIDLFTQPLFDVVADLLPDFRPLAAYCQDGRRVWADLATQEEARESSITPNSYPSDQQLPDMDSLTPSPVLTPRPPSMRYAGKAPTPVNAGGSDSPEPSFRGVLTPTAALMREIVESRGRTKNLTAQPLRSTPPFCQSSPVLSASSQSSLSPATNYNPSAPEKSRMSSALPPPDRFAVTLGIDDEYDRGPLSPATATVACTGDCVLVTAKCAACTKREAEEGFPLSGHIPVRSRTLDVRRTPMEAAPAIRRIEPTLLTLPEGLLAADVGTWPPNIFCPTFPS